MHKEKVEENPGKKCLTKWVGHHGRGQRAAREGPRVPGKKGIQQLAQTRPDGNRPKPFLHLTGKKAGRGKCWEKRRRGERGEVIVANILNQGGERGHNQHGTGGPGEEDLSPKRRKSGPRQCRTSGLGTKKKRGDR